MKQTSNVEQSAPFLGKEEPQHSHDQSSTRHDHGAGSPCSPVGCCPISPPAWTVLAEGMQPLRPRCHTLGSDLPQQQEQHWYLQGLWGPACMDGISLEAVPAVGLPTQPLHPTHCEGKGGRGGGRGSCTSMPYSCIQIGTCGNVKGRAPLS